MPEPIVIEVDSEPVHGWRGPCVDPVAAQLAIARRRDLSTPGLLTWVKEDDCTWRVTISAGHVGDGLALRAPELRSCWITARAHPLGWALKALDQIVVEREHGLTVRTLEPVVDLPARLEAVWLWPDLPLEACSLRDLPGNRGVMFSSGRGRAPLIFLRTETRREGIRLWESGHVHATSTTGHDPSDVPTLRSRKEWREGRTEIAGVVFVKGDTVDADKAAHFSHVLDRERLVNATGGMADMLFDATQIHLPLASRDGGSSRKGSASPAAVSRHRALPLIYSGFPPNGAVCVELAAQFAQAGLACFPRELPWSDYLEVLRRRDWSMIFMLLPAPWSGPLALIEAMATIIGGRNGAPGQSCLGIPLFTLRSGTLLRDPVSHAILERWGGLKFRAPERLAIRNPASARDTLAPSENISPKEFR